MKKYIIAFMLLIVVFQSQAQQNIAKVYQTRTDIRVFRYDFLEQCLLPIPKIAEKGSIFEIIALEQGVYIVKFWQKIDTTQNEQYIDCRDFKYYFALSEKDFSEKCKRYIHRVVTFGAIFVPIKLRLGGTNGKTFDFSKDVAIGNAIGLRRSVNETKGYSVNYLFSLGITSVSLDSSTTQGYIKENRDFAAFTPSIGAVWEFQNTQLGFFTGVDLLGRGLGKKWAYQKTFSPWFSIGIGVGFQIFSKPSVASATLTWKRQSR
jgi:hypothetical protein